ncbi:MAG: molybdopterin-binding protein [Pseudomonadota bacterium]
MPSISAAMVAIGDELLSGRTRDANIHHLSGWLTERGIRLVEVRIIEDDLGAIAAAVNALRTRFDYVFTSGGIGPTHDDITYEAIARAFDRPCTPHPEAMALITTWYEAKGQAVTPERARMALMPEGATLIHNTASGAPGVQLDNVFVLAGVPRIFQAMLTAIDPVLTRGVRRYSKAVTAHGLPESKLARQLADIQAALNGVSIGSYPIDGDEWGVTVVVRSESEMLVNQVIVSVRAAMQALGADPVDGDRK